MNTKLGTESETGIAPKESGSEFRTLLRHDYLISSCSTTSSFLLRVRNALLLRLAASGQVARFVFCRSFGLPILQF